MNTKSIVHGALVLMLAAVMAEAPASALAGSLVTTSLRATLVGSIFANNEWIDLSGDTHLLIQALPTDPCTPTDPCRQPPIRVHVNMAGVTGIGRTSGQQYVLNGSENFEFDGTLPAYLQFQGSYRLIPPTPIVPPSPIVPVDFTVQINESGVASGAIASVGTCTTDVCPGGGM